MNCPQCRGYVSRVLAIDGGCIEETVCTKGGLRRRVRPATFYACSACEWCSESAPPDVDEGETVDDTELADGKRCEVCGCESCICG